MAGGAGDTSAHRLLCRLLRLRPRGVMGNTGAMAARPRYAAALAAGLPGFRPLRYIRGLRPIVFSRSGGRR